MIKLYYIIALAGFVLCAIAVLAITPPLICEGCPADASRVTPEGCYLCADCARGVETDAVEGVG